MNSSRPLVREKALSSVPAQLLSNWVEIFAIPIAAAIMETQPLTMLLTLVRPYLLGADAIIPGSLTITLLILVMQWWAMGLQSMGKGDLLRLRGGPAPRTLSGLIIGALLIVLLQPSGLGDTGFFFVAIFLLVGCWYRGLHRAHDPLNDEYLSISFRVGFMALMVVLVFAVLSSLQGEGHDSLSQDLTRALPIFFLSGLICLSFSRIARLRREQKRHPGSNAKEATGRWLSGLTITWIVLVVGGLALEALPLGAIMDGLSPLWLILLWLGQNILYLLSFLIYGFLFVLGFSVGGIIKLLDSIFHFSSGDAGSKAQRNITPIAPPIKNTGHQSSVLPIIIAVVVLAVVIVVIFTLTRKKKDVVDDTSEDEEVRESLDREQIIQERRERKRRQQAALTLEPLDPATMRARYREFLQAMATQGEETQRYANETPLEYQRRLLKIARQRHLLHDDQEAEILGELTLAYARERYGGKQVDSEQQVYIGNNVPRLVQKFAGSAAPATRPAAGGWSAAKARWGED